MDWTTIWHNRRRKLSPKLRGTRGARSNRRKLVLESLESRALLAADVEPLVAFRLGVADPVTLQPVTTVHAGDEFALVAYVRDLRDQPEGAYSAYLDINFPAAQFEVSGPIRHLGGFVNGDSGTVASGILDELGGFADSLKPPGGAEQMVVAIPFIARQAGDFTFTADAADLLVGHEVLLFGSNDHVSSTAIEFQSIAVKVLPSSSEITQLDAIDDEFFLRSSASQRLDVLANDSSPAPSTIKIDRIEPNGAVGQATISGDHGSIEYSAPVDFSGVDTLQYTIVDSSGKSDSATVTIHVENGTAVDEKASFRLVTTDRVGRPISTVNQGDEFLLKVFVADIRDEPKGVFAAYVDIAFPPQLARVAGSLEFPGTFSNGIAGSIQTPGLIDEAGAFASHLFPPGDGEYLLFQVPLKALHAGKAIFQSGPADAIPDHQSLLFGQNSPLDPKQIVFDQVQLDIRPALIVVDDSVDIAVGSGPVLLNVLANDQALSTSPLTITHVDTTDLRGTVSVAADGSSLTYTPAVDSRGTEVFRYTAANSRGSATAQVTIHLQPLSALDDVVQIRLAATDLNGQALTSVNAGDAFAVQAFVRDLRSLIGANRGIYAAYFDLLYDSARASVVPSASNARGIEVTFGPQFQNGKSGIGAIPGVLDEFGAFQTSSTPTGVGEELLFTAMFQASAGRSGTDRFIVQEDTAADLNVLENDQPNQGVISFHSDPADVQPQSDVLLYDPVQPVADSAIRYLSTSVNVSGGAVQIASVVPSQRGGTVTIGNNGQVVRYEPPANYVGEDEFTYSLGPGNNTVVHIHVSPVNDAPHAESDHYVASQQRTLQVSAANGLLSNDSDVDRDSLRARLVTTTAHGQLLFNEDGSFSYTPTSGFSGTDRFVYQSSDGKLVSANTEVQIEVAPPIVQIRLEATDSLGQPLATVQAGSPFVLHAYVQDERDDSRSDRGVGAVFMDLTFDSSIAQPRIDPANYLGFDVTFGPKYQHTVSGDVDSPGLVDDIGAMQTQFTPTGRSELEIFSIMFQTAGPRAANDAVRASRNSSLNIIDVLENENGKSFSWEIQSRDSGNSPWADIVLFEPAQAIPGTDVSFGRTTVDVQNSSQLVIESVEPSTAGGATSIDSLGRGIRYTPPAGFAGTDSFTYTVRDEAGRRATATVTVEVVVSWSNENNNNDVNSDSFVSTIDPLQVINFVNLFGGRKLEGEHTGSSFLDVNNDGYITPIDALILINFLSQSLNGGAEGEDDHTFDPLRNLLDENGAIVILPLEESLMGGIFGPATNGPAKRGSSSLATADQRILLASTCSSSQDYAASQMADGLADESTMDMAATDLLAEEELELLAAAVLASC